MKNVLTIYEEMKVVVNLLEGRVKDLEADIASCEHHGLKNSLLNSLRLNRELFADAQYRLKEWRKAYYL